MSVGLEFWLIFPVRHSGRKQSESHGFPWLLCPVLLSSSSCFLLRTIKYSSSCSLSFPASSSPKPNQGWWAHTSLRNQMSFKRSFGTFLEDISYNQGPTVKPVIWGNLCLWNNSRTLWKRWTWKNYNFWHWNSERGEVVNDYIKNGVFSHSKWLS